MLYALKAREIPKRYKSWRCELKIPFCTGYYTLRLNSTVFVTPALAESVSEELQAPADFSLRVILKSV